MLALPPGWFSHVVPPSVFPPHPAQLSLEVCLSSSSLMVAIVMKYHLNNKNLISRNAGGQRSVIKV
jgi:hypothetical protein